MKVTLASLSYLPGVGGLVSYMASFGKHLVKRENEVQIICSNNPQCSLLPEEVMDNIKVNRIDALRRTIVDVLFKPFIVVHRISRWLKNSNQDSMLIVVRHVYLAAALALSKTHRSRTVFLIPLAASRLVWINRNEGNIFRWAYNIWLIPQMYFLEFFTLRRLDHIAVLSASKQKEITKYYGLPQQPHLVPPGIDIERFRPPNDDQERKDILKKLGRSNDQNQKIILTVCRLVAEKNVTLLLDAFVNLSDQSTILYIVGEGPLRAELERQSESHNLSQRIVFWGQRSDTELFYRVSDLFVLPSTYEGFGHVFLEALASGVPVAGLASQPPEVTTATEEIVTRDTGYIIEQNSPEALSNVMMSHFAGGTDVSSANCREYAVSRFSWDSHLSLLLEIIGDDDV